MPVVSDFTVIQGDNAVRIGDNAISWQKTFRTGGRVAAGSAMLMFMVKGLTAANVDARVFINDQSVGVVERSKGGNREHWFTQIVNIGSNVLNDGNNELRINAVSNPNPGSDNFDDFFLKDVVCHFKQEVS